MLSLHPISGLPISAVSPASGLSGPVLFRFSDRRYITAPDDPTLPSVAFQPRALEPLSIERSLPLAPGAGSRSLTQVGEIAFVNADGGMDSFIRDYAIDGREIVVKAGRPEFAYGEFETIFKGTARGRKDAGRQRLSFELRDAIWELEKPLQTRLYAGTGGLEGGADIAGKSKPVGYGWLLNVPPVLVDPVKQIYQLHDGRMLGVSQVYDKGIPLNPAGDVADIAAASAPSPGTYITQLTGGYIRLGSVPAGLVTCDFQGDASYGLFVETVADIGYRLIRDRGGFADERMDPLSFDLLRSQQPAAVGIWAGLEPVPLAVFLDQLFGGIGGWWGVNRLGVVECGRIDAPLVQPAAWFTAIDVIDYTFLSLPEGVDPPLWRVTVGYQKNWQPQQLDLAGGVSAERRTFLAATHRFATWSDPAIQVAYARAQDAQPLAALFRDQLDAELEAARLGALWGKGRTLLRLTTKVQGYLVKLGSTVNIDLPIGPLDGGRNVVVVGQGIVASQNATAIDVIW